MSSKVNLVPAFLFYVLYVAGLLYFVVIPSLKVKKLPLWRVFLAGGFFGLVAYATYDLTSYATTIHWPFQVTIIDMSWGLFNSGVTASIGYLIGKKS